MMVKRFIGLLIALIVSALPCLGQTVIDGFIPRHYQASNGRKMPYRLFMPRAYDKSRKYPLILWLHGAGGAGTDNIRQISGDQIDGTRTWTKPEVQAKYPAFLLVPQSTGVWAVHDELVLVLAILDSLEHEFSIDSQRIYIAGQSNGGVGTWDFISSQPDVFAAAIPLCGFGNPAFAGRLAKMPIWAFNGVEDVKVVIIRTRQMIAAIQKAGGAPRYTEYKRVGHDVWKHAFKEPGLVDWLFAQHK